MARTKHRKPGGGGPPSRPGPNNSQPPSNQGPKNRPGAGQQYRPRSRSPPRNYRPRSRSPRRGPPQHSSPFQFGQRYRSQRDDERGGNRQPRPRDDENPRDLQDHGRVSFDFRSNVAAPRFPAQNAGNRQFDRADNRQGNQHFDRADNRQGNRRKNDRFRREYRRFPQTHDRPIMRALREGEGERTPERLDGMAEAPNRFHVLEGALDLDDHASSDSVEDTEMEPSKKRQKVDDDVKATQVPKWSNPDPYTVLPPADESRAKRLDVVKLIRNSKLTPSAGDSATSQNAIVENADFVSLDFGSREDPKEDENPEEYVPPEPTVNDLNIVATVQTQNIHGLPAKPPPPLSGFVPAVNGELVAVAPPLPLANASSVEHELHVSSGFSIQMERLNLVGPKPTSTLTTAAAQRAEAAARDQRDSYIPEGPSRGTKRKRTVVEFGTISPEWLTLGRQHVDPTPWFRPKAQDSPNMGLRYKNSYWF
jgi:hypothetical protein